MSLVGTTVTGAKQSTDLVQISTANTNTDGTGTLVTAKTAGTNGSWVTKVKVKATGTTTAGVSRFYASNGTNSRLIGEAVIDANTASGTNPSFETTWYPDGGRLNLPTGWELRAAPHNAETFNLVVDGGDY